ncbi:hypothetical protein predicted by Glimmer/Critica [Acetobacter ghanensis]|uniref:Uncharacterized protein n=1 Tax=Acetobacter ghanensis TaxID=431306 RepID=A0A0U5BK35_9PROT|nr:hypothetical protein predicted by Glimmer/Critica [Acetobacter ghanensis]
MNWRDILFGAVFLFWGGILPLYLYLESVCLTLVLSMAEAGRG